MTGNKNIVQKLLDKYHLMQNDILSYQSNNLAFFKGNISPELLVVGEAPGPQEDIIGKPFVGPAGKELDSGLKNQQIDTSKIAFLNVVFRMPLGSNGSFRPPDDIEIKYYAPLVKELINLLEPSVILACGNVACQSLINQRGIIKLRGRWHGNILPTYHPSYIVRHPQYRKIFIADINQIKNKLIP